MQQSKNIEKTKAIRNGEFNELAMLREERKRQEKEQRKAARQAKQNMLAM